MKDFRGPPPVKDKSNREAGEVPANRIPIHDHEGNVRGHVTKAATQATVARFLGRHGATLETVEGRQTWVGSKPPPPPPPPELPGLSPMETSKGEAEIGLIQARTQALASKPNTKSKVKKPGA